MKKLKRKLLGILLIGICFYTTNDYFQTQKEKDPIMQEIKEKRKKYEIEYQNASIKNNQITSGKKGRKIDYNASYSKMKKYGSFNESLIITKEIQPTISIEKNYDKYIIKGNQSEKKVSLIFPITEENTLENIITILKKKEVPATFFIDGKVLEKDTNIIRENPNYEYELLSYHNSYQKAFFKTSLSYLEMITKKESKYCYTEQENEELLELCKNRKLHTIMPSKRIKKELYQEIKKNLSNSNFYSIEPNTYNLRKLSMTIDYIEEKGYQITKLKELLKE